MLSVFQALDAVVIICALVLNPRANRRRRRRREAEAARDEEERSNEEIREIKGGDGAITQQPATLIEVF